MRSQSMTVCVNDTDSGVNCATASSRVSCAYADSSVTTDDALEYHKCEDNPWAPWLNMLGGTMPQ